MRRLPWWSVASVFLCLVSAEHEAACGPAIGEDAPAHGNALLQVQHATLGAAVLVDSAKQSTRRSNASCDGRPREMQADPSFQFGHLHDVVGRDGVLVISLLRKNSRFDFSADKLRLAGIFATEFAAADVECLSEDQLSSGCLKAEAEGNAQKCEGRAGTGCMYVNEQAVAESHRRALVAASERENKWTAILEDDVVPVRPEIWNAAFEKAWKLVPEHVKLVRLSWCAFPGDNPGSTVAQDVFQDTGEFHLLSWVGYNPGHRYNPVDCCLLYDLFAKGWEEDKPQGLDFMMHLDADGSTEYAKGFHLPWVHQSGVMVQDARSIPSTQAWVDTIKSVDNPELVGT